MSTRKAIPKAEAIKLWTRAYGICSYPDCGRELVWGSESTRLRGEMAHIVASSAKWTRGDPTVDPDSLRRYENLILLCPNHHEEIDAASSGHTVESLVEMKRTHENNIAERLGRGEFWQEDLGSIDYLNLPRLLLDPAAQPQMGGALSSLVSLETETLRGMGMALGHVTLAFEQVFRSWRAQALPFSAIAELGSEATGARISIDRTFFTKGMTGADKQKPGFELSGQLEKDPHIYLKEGERTVFVPLDPRWVTTSTAFHDFTRGRGKFAGLGMVKSVSAKRAVISPLVLGRPPLSPWVKEFYAAAES